MHRITTITLASLALATWIPNDIAAQCESERFPLEGQVAVEEVALDGDVLVVGDWFATVDGEEFSGRVHTYFLDDSGETHHRELVASDPQNRLNFGRSVAIAGDTLVVGCPSYIHFGVGFGHVYSFRRDRAGTTDVADDTWVEEQVLVSNGYLHGFGFSVAVSESTLVVGAPFSPAPFSDTGTVFVYARVDGLWEETHQLHGTGSGLGDMAGWDVDIDGDRIAFSVPGLSELPPLSGNSSRTGGVFLYDRIPGDPGDPLDDDWVEATRLTNDNLVFGAHLGEFIDLRGPSVVARGRNAAGVVLFEEQGATWTETRVPFDGRIEGIPAGTEPRTVALNDDYVAAGYRLAESGPIGTVVVLNRDDDFSPHAILTGSQSVAFEVFGESLALDDTRLAAGAHDGVDTGTTYVFGLDGRECALGASRNSDSLTAGVTQELRLDAGPIYAGRPYLVLVSASGTSPGFPLGSITLPLAVDSYTAYSLVHPNQPPYSGSLGFLDPQGRATAQFSLNPGAVPFLAGTSLHHAFLVFDASGMPAVPTFASNSVDLRLHP